MEWFWLMLIIAIPVAIFSGKINKKVSSKKVSMILLSVGLIMLVLAIVFISYALQHPESAYPWSNIVTYIIYIIYLFTNIVTLILAWIYKRKKEHNP